MTRAAGFKNLLKRYFIAGCAILLVAVVFTRSSEGQAVVLSPKFEPTLQDLLLELDPLDIVSVIVTTEGPAQASVDAVELLVPSFNLFYVYDEIFDGYAAEMTKSELIALLAPRSEVTGIFYDHEVELFLDDAVPAVKADAAHTAGFEGDGVTVAVIDSGIPSGHPAFQNAVIGCVSFTEGMQTSLCEDTLGHGALVSNILLGRDAPYKGIAPKAKLVAVKAFATAAGRDKDILAAMRWIGANHDNFNPPIKVVSTSFGRSPTFPDLQSPQMTKLPTMDGSLLGAGVRYLVGKGLTVTAAAGNSGPNSGTIATPGDEPMALTVGGTDMKQTVTIHDDDIASNSSRGPTANGVIKPDIVAPITTVTTAFLAGTYIESPAGTSLSSPQVAGAAVLLLEQDATRTPTEIKSLLTSTAKLPSAFNTVAVPDNDWGYGILDVCDALGLSGC